MVNSVYNADFAKQNYDFLSLIIPDIIYQTDIIYQSAFSLLEYQ